MLVLFDNQSPLQKGGVYHHPLFQRGNPDVAAILPRINGNSKGGRKSFDLPEVTPISTDVSEHSTHGNEEMPWGSLCVARDSTSETNPSTLEMSRIIPKHQYIQYEAELGGTPWSSLFVSGDSPSPIEVWKNGLNRHSIEQETELRGGTSQLSSSFVPSTMSEQSSSPQLELPFKAQIADVAIPTTGRMTELGRPSPMTSFNRIAVSIDTMTYENSILYDCCPRSVEVDTPSWLLWEPFPMRFSTEIHAKHGSPKTFEEGTENIHFDSKEDLRREIIKTFLAAS